MENPIKMDDLGVPLVLETFIWKQECHYWTSTSGEIGGGLGWWFGILVIPLSNNSFLQGDLRNPNHKPKPTNNESLIEESNSKKIVYSFGSHDGFQLQPLTHYTFREPKAVYIQIPL